MAGSGFDSEKIKAFYKGENSDKDGSYINEVFFDNNSEKDLKNLLSRQYIELFSEEETDNKNLDHILYKIHYEINTKLAERKGKKIAKFLNWTLRMAGIIILPIAVFFGIKGYLYSHSGKETWVEIKAPAWTRAQFSLPDGTTGWLNSNSSIRYNGTFNTDRHITLKGEAFFDVFKDKKRPFVVDANEVVLSVLGTRFNIASYENEKNVEVVLAEGKLKFNNKEMNESFLMSPNDLVIYDKTHKNFSTKVVEPQKYLSWTEGKLVFRNDPVDVVARRLERWYNIDVEVNGSLAEDIRLRATFIDESLEEVLYFLKRSLPIDYKIENRNLKPDETYAKKKVIIFSKTK